MQIYQQANKTAVHGLRKAFTGEIIVAGDPGYDEARTVFNAMIDKRPGVIAQCAGVDDVVRALRFGREQGLDIAVRGGGHSVAGKALTDGGLVICLPVEPRPHKAPTCTRRGGPLLSPRQSALRGLSIGTPEQRSNKGR